MLLAVSLRPHPDPAWRGRVIATLMLLLVLWPMLIYSEFNPLILFEKQSLLASWDFLASMLPPACSVEFLQMLILATWQTVAIATAGLTLAMLGAIPLALIATESLSISRIETGRMRLIALFFRQLVRWCLVLLRSVPELVWALLFVRIVGLGATAGVLAIALTYCGMLGKVYAEILDSSDIEVAENLLKNGAGRLLALLYGALPNAASELVSYTTYRWECAIRGSVVMGFVGAGGLGQRMDESLKMMAGNEVASMLIIFVLLVGVADRVSAALRNSL